MHPIIGEIPIIGVELRSYQVVRWTYFIIAAGLTAYLNSRRGIRVGQTLGAFLVGIPAALVGGHLLNVFEAWPFYREYPERILDVLVGGNSIYGALTFGVGAGVGYFWWQRVPLRGFLDAAAPALALGEAMTRVGCFLNGCCFCHPTLGVFGVRFPRESQVFVAQVAAGLIVPGSASSLPVHPTQLYSALICAALFVLLLWLFLRGRLFPGALFCTFLVGYGLQRLVVGWWRADTALYWWEVTNALSVATLVVAGMLWILWRHRREQAGDEVEAQAGESVAEEQRVTQA